MSLHKGPRDPMLAGFLALSIAPLAGCVANTNDTGRLAWGSYEAREALIYGVEGYRNIRDAAHPAYRSAMALKEALESNYGFHVQYAVSTSNGRSEGTGMPDAKLIREGLSRLKKPNAMSDDTLLFVYFVGHGIVDNAGIPYFQPHDAEPGDFRSSIRFDEIVNAVAASSARHRVLVFDTCYAGRVQHLPAIAFNNAFLVFTHIALPFLGFPEALSRASDDQSLASPSKDAFYLPELYIIAAGYDRWNFIPSERYTPLSAVLIEGLEYGADLAIDRGHFEAKDLGAFIFSEYKKRFGRMQKPPPSPFCGSPLWRANRGSATFVVARPESLVSRAIRDLIRHTEPRLVLTGIQELQRSVEERLTQARFLSELLNPVMRLAVEAYVTVSADLRDGDAASNSAEIQMAAVQIIDRCIDHVEEKSDSQFVFIRDMLDNMSPHEQVREESLRLLRFLSKPERDEWYQKLSSSSGTQGSDKYASVSTKNQ